MITIAPATPADVDTIVDLLAEMNEFYGVLSCEARAESVALTRAALTGATPAGRALLAWDGDDLAGMAAYTLHWPGRGARSLLFLKELYVRDGRRGQGVGRQLMDALFTTARDLGIDWVDWQAEAANVAARRFYERLGAKQRPKVSYRIEL